MKNLIRNLRGIFIFSLLALNTVVWITPLLVLALVKLVLPFAGARRALTRMLMAIAENWISVNRLILAGSGSFDWSLPPTDELKRDGWYLVLSNHQTWVDIVVLQSVFNRRIPLLKFFIKQELIWFPLLGLGWWALDMPFMKRFSPSYLAKHPEKKGKDLEATRRACEKFRHTPTSVINFVEGTRFSEAKRDARESPYRHLLKPRAGGVAIAMSSMGELFDAILDVTIVYPDGVPDFWEMCCGDVVRADIGLVSRPLDRRLVAGDYQGDRAYRREVHQWLSGIWHEKDSYIDAKLETVR